MILALLLLISGMGRVTLLEGEVTIPKLQARSLPIHLKQKPGTVYCSFRVIEGRSGVRAALQRRAEDGSGKAEVVAATAYVDKGNLAVRVPSTGEYELILDNRMEGRDDADVQLAVWLAFNNPAPVEVRYLEPEKRTLVIWLSLCFFVGTVFYSGRRLLDALRRRDEPF
jgi:hypothetical protein